MKPIRVSCPSCAVGLRVPPTSAGKSVSCPKCKTAVPVPTSVDEPARPAFEVVDDPAETVGTEASTAAAPDSESKSSRSKSRPVRTDAGRGWRRARLGMTLLLVAAAMSILSLVVGLAASFLGVGGVFLTLFGSLAVTALQAGVALAGMILLTFTPLSHAPRPLLYICIALAVVVKLSSIGLAVWALRMNAEYSQSATEQLERLSETGPDAARRRAEAQEKIMQQALQQLRQIERLLFGMRVVSLLGNIQAILFPLFLRELASSLKVPDAMTLCETIIKLTVLGIGLTWVPYGLMQLRMPLDMLMGVFKLLMAAGALASLGCQVAFVVLYARLREASRPLTRARRKRDAG